MQENMPRDMLLCCMFKNNNNSLEVKVIFFLWEEVAVIKTKQNLNCCMLISDTYCVPDGKPCARLSWHNEKA